MIRIRNLFDALLILEMVAAIVITQACSFQVPSGSLPSAQQLASAAGSAEQPSPTPTLPAKQTHTPEPTPLWQAEKAAVRATEAALPTPVPPEVTDALTEPVQITTRPAPRGLLAVDGDYVVWRSYEDGQTNIVAFSLKTGSERRISSLPGGKLDLKISGGFVVWTDVPRPEDTQRRQCVHVYDLITGVEREVGLSNNPQGGPAISGQVVVWGESRTQGHPLEVDIYGYDLQHEQEFPVVVRPGLQAGPRISGDWVIYLDWPSGARLTGRLPDQPTLRAHRLSTGEDVEIGQVRYGEASSSEYYSISGQNVVWLEPDGGVYSYNLSTDQKRSLPLRKLTKLDLHGSVLHAGDIYNLDTGATLKLFQPDRSERPTAVSEVATDGQTVVWLFDGAAREPLEGRIYVARLKRVP
jgi:hypothetical protein